MAEDEPSGDEVEINPSGTPTIRYAPRDTRWTPPGGYSSVEAIERHIEQYLARPTFVFHEVASRIVHVDVHVVPPGEQRAFYTLVTTGMSDLPMTLPPAAVEADRARHVELMMCLPPDWAGLEQRDAVTPPATSEGQRWAWPVEWLRYLARFPHEYKTWLGFGHTMPNGDPPEPLADNTLLSGILLMNSLTVPKAMWRLEADGKMIEFLAVWPLYPEEQAFKLQNGTNALIERFERHGVTDLVNLTRVNTCA
jgi:hypothetical protein